MLGLGRLYDTIPLVIPVDLASSQTGDLVTMRDAGGADIFIFCGDGAAGRDITFTFKRHTDISDTSGTTMALPPTSQTKYFRKEHATTVVGVAQWEAVTWPTDADGATVVVDDTDGEESQLYCFHVSRGDLGDGYTAFSFGALVTANAGAKIGCAWVNLVDLAVQRAPQNLRSAVS